MNIFAHNGVNHSTLSEASAHILSDWIKILAAIIVVSALLAIIYISARRFGFVTITTKDRRDR